MTTAPRRSRTWVVDNGASHHMTPLSNGMENLRHRHGEVLVGDCFNNPIHSIGEMRLKSDGRGGFHTSHVLYVLGLGVRFLSMSQQCKLKLLVEFSMDHFWIRDRASQAVVCEGKERNGLYILRDTAVLTHSLTSFSVFQMWHARYGHLNYEYFRRAFKDKLVIGLPNVDP